MVIESLPSPVGFWGFVGKCFGAAKDTTFSYLNWDAKTVVTAILLLILGYLIFASKRGVKDAKQRVWEDYLLNFAPLGVFAIGLFVFNCIRSPHLVYKEQGNEAVRLVNEADARRIAAEKLAKSLQDQIDQKEPQFNIEIDYPAITWAGKDKRGVMIVLMGKVQNLGGPGSVDKFWMSLKVNGKVLVGEFPIAPAPNDRFGFTIGGKHMFLDGSDYFTKAVSGVPIQYMGHTDGWLIAVFKGITVEQVLKQKATVVITCSDITGKKFSSEYTWGNLPPYQPFGIGDIQKQ